MIEKLWIKSGGASIPEKLDEESLFERIVVELRRQHKPSVIRSAAEVAFVDSVFNPKIGMYSLVTFNSGRFWIERAEGARKLRYEFSSRQGFLVCCCIGLCLFMALLVIGAGGARALTYGLLAFIYLYGTGLLIAAIRVPALVNRLTQHNPSTQTHKTA